MAVVLNRGPQPLQHTQSSKSLTSTKGPILHQTPAYNTNRRQLRRKTKPNVNESRALQAAGVVLSSKENAFNVELRSQDVDEHAQVRPESNCDSSM